MRGMVKKLTKATKPPSSKQSDMLLREALSLAGEPCDPLLASFPIEGETPPSITDIQEEFLRVIAEHGCTDTTAAMMVGRSRWSPIEWKRKPEFMERYRAARKVSLDHLVREAERRAMNGSDRLLEFLLTNYAPERFSSQRSKLEVKGGADIVERITRGRERARAKSDDGTELAG